MIQKEFIRNELRYRYPNLKDCIRNPLQSVGRPLLFESSNRTFGARIIVCTHQELDALAGSGQDAPLFLCIGTPSARVLAEYDVCVLPEGEQESAILNFIQRLFDRLDDWTQSLRQAAETGEGVEQLLMRASGMLQNPVLLLDSRGHIVAKSAFEENVSAINPFLSDNLLNTQQNAGRIHTTHSDSVPEAIFVRVRSGEADFILVCLSSERPLYASDEIVLESLAGFLRLMLSERTLRLGLNRKPRKSEAACEQFRALLRQEGSQKQAIDSLAQIGWSETDEYAVLAIEPNDGDLRVAQADAICNLLEEKLEHCCAFSFSPVVVAVVRTGILEMDSFQSKLKEIAQKNEIRIGICETFPGFALLLERLRQAEQALNGAIEHGGTAVFADVFEREFSRGSLQNTPKELLCMRSVRALAEYDRAHETNYLETAEQYAKNRFNAVRTAGELFIHRSTFLYRLDRIKAQFGLDLDDRSLSLLHLMLSFSIVKQP